VGQFEVEARDPAPDPQIQVVQRHGPYSHDYCAAGDYRLGRFADFQYFRSAEC
jgi:hypothetical protein